MATIVVPPGNLCDNGKYLSASPPGRAASMHDSARTSPEPQNAFEQLVIDINRILGPCNGLDSNGVDVGELKYILRDYKSNEAEWERYAFGDASRAYTRNLVDKGNGKANLLLLVWTPGKGSPIHDHANAHCVMKILKGRLTETIYGWPCQRAGDGGSACSAAPGQLYPNTKHSCSVGANLEPAALQVLRSTTYYPEQVNYMSDRLGLHRIQNPSEDEFAVSLHLYTPPNAAKHGCHIFDEKTGKKSHVLQNHFYSELGVFKG